MQNTQLGSPKEKQGGAEPEAVDKGKEKERDGDKEGQSRKRKKNGKAGQQGHLKAGKENDTVTSNQKEKGSGCDGEWLYCAAIVVCFP